MEISEKLSFMHGKAAFTPAFKNHFWDGKIKLLDLKTRLLSLGLHSHVADYCKDNDYKVVYNDPIDVEAPFSVEEFKRMLNSLKLSTMTEEGRVEIIPYDFQEKAVIHAIQANRSLILSPTASGKSLILYIYIRYYLAKLNPKSKILIIVPTTNLVQQLYTDFEDYAAKINWNVESNCHMIFDGAEKYTNKRVIISTWQALAVKRRLPKEIRDEMTKFQIKKWNKAAPYILKDDYFKQFEVVCGDEAHLHAQEDSGQLTEIMSKLINAKYRIGTTGTLKDTKIHHLILEGIFGKVYQTTTTREMMDRKQAAELVIKCLQLQYPDTERKKMRKATYPEEMDFLLAHTVRNAFIRNLALSLDGNTLVLFERVETHGKILHELIAEKISEDRKLFYVHGKTKTIDRNLVRKIVETELNAIMVCSFGTFSTGVSIRNINNIIFASPTKAKIRVLQSIGRGLRLSKRKFMVTLFDISDDLSYWNKNRTEVRDNYSLQHFTERVNFYNAEDFFYKIYKIALT